MSHGRNSSDDDAAMGCIVYLLAAIICMPIVGLVFICGKDPDKKALGWFLLVAGIVLWVIVGVMGS